ncbi:MAG: hypothetical protein ACPHXR_00425 [Flavicella sp.]
MEDKKPTKSNKPIIIVLAILLAAAIGYGVYSHIESTAKETQLLAEKAAVTKKLDALIVQYEKKIAESDALEAELVAARANIIAYRDSLANEKKTSFLTIKRYRSKVYKLEKQNKALFAKIDALTAENQELNEEITVVKDSIVQMNEENVALTNSNEILKAKVAIGAKLSIDNLKAVAMKKSSTGLSATTKYKSTRAFRVSFKIKKNELTSPGEKLAYLVVKDPEGTIVSPKGRFERNGKESFYSSTTNVDFQNEEKEVIFITDVEKDDMMKGAYTFNVYLEGAPVGKTAVLLRGSFLGIF